METLIKEGRVPHKMCKCIRISIIYADKTYKWIMNDLKGPNLTTDGWREGRGKDLYKTKS